jgi:hypothetical protein
MMSRMEGTANCEASEGPLSLLVASGAAQEAWKIFETKPFGSYSTRYAIAAADQSGSQYTADVAPPGHGENLDILFA